jgi:hypothetical protein
MPAAIPQRVPSARLPAWLPGPPAGHGLRSRRPLRPFRCERGIGIGIGS